MYHNELRMQYKDLNWRTKEKQQEGRIVFFYRFTAMFQLGKVPYWTAALRQFIFRRSKYAGKKTHKEVVHNHLISDRCKITTLFACLFVLIWFCEWQILSEKPFLAQGKEPLSITCLFHVVRLQPSLLDDSQPSWIFMSSLGMLSQMERRGKILAESPLLHLILKGVF